MNYLAHLLLAGEDSEFQLGNLLGDFVKGPLSEAQHHYSSTLVQGLALHRAVDKFTDTHPIPLQSRRRLGKPYQRLSGIIIDIAYDHFLANHWHNFSLQPLESFIAEIYRLLQTNQHRLPLRLKQSLPRMVDQNWLGSCQTLEGLKLTYTRVANRLKRQNNLSTADRVIRANYEGLESDFCEFFPQLVDYVEIEKTRTPVADGSSGTDTPC
ncbi:acyl carrier protein phosphodiesterase [Roseofilum sp. BLCC_M91]|uniref:Acyl carrier protein phosphodiesterase n=1 Tax=Roseofilum halophilum BLCC-M91 TaxID=3022259 RepID=A0ABT7BI95_9CYAN|nr:acyl carrier protein phosphodiesterase [Roseofilum halophilum]MDJ1178904.1 acyl carrier protein phosphodiesterase [Roseofilum halophilum BLCC-M91]